MINKCKKVKRWVIPFVSSAELNIKNKKVGDTFCEQCRIKY